MKVAIIGAAGHVGFPFSLVLADAGHEVIGIDRNPAACIELSGGFSPHMEEGSKDLLLNMLKANRVTYTTDDERIQECDAVAIMIGTPIDGEGNPRLDDILDFVKYTLAPQLNENMLIVLRSTVAPGTTDLIESILLEETSLKFHIVFAPERVAQGVGIVESKKFPQLIGARTKEAFDLAVKLFNFVPECIHLTPREAEFGKLVTNMYRYVTFALANEFYMIGTDQGLNVHKVIDAVNKDYPRMSLPKPGPNVGGPCLFKDGKFLLEDVPYADLIQTSFLINEGMPKYIFDRILKISVKRVNKIGILGATFKADCDDVRNSLSFKFAKICKRHGIEYAFFDPYIAHPDNVWPTHDINDYDAFVVMTPHRQFQKFYDEHISKRKSIVIADGWKYLHSSKETIDGVYVI